MNIIRWPTATEARLDEAKSNLITGCPLYEITNDNLYIKKDDDLILIGGTSKQDLLTEGKNIEILETAPASSKIIYQGNDKIIITFDTNKSFTIYYYTDTQITNNSAYVRISNMYNNENSNPTINSKISKMSYNEVEDYYYCTLEYNIDITNKFFSFNIQDLATSSWLSGTIGNQLRTWPKFQHSQLVNNVIKTTDDIIIDNITIETSDHSNPKWKASIKLGELTNNNHIFLLMKETSLQSDNQSLIGGDLIIKMTLDDSQERYAEYSFTVASNGQWSIKGASEFSNNAKICKVDYNNETYYGIKIPDSSFTEEIIHDTQTYTDRNLSATTYLQYCGDRSLALGYTDQGNQSPQTLEFEEHIRDELVNDNSGDISIDTYSISVRQLVDNLKDDNNLWNTSVSTSSDVLPNQWKTWYAEDKKFNMEVWSRTCIGPALTNIRKTVLGLRRIGNSSQYQGVFQLVRKDPNTGSALATQNLTCRGVAENPDGSQYISSHNRWYTCSVSAFNTLLGYTSTTPLGTTYNNNNYHICFRIHYNNNNKQCRITKVMIVDDRSNVSAQANHIRWDIFATDANGRNMEYEANDPNLPFENINSALFNIEDPPVYQSTISTTLNYTIGTFLDKSYSNPQEYLEIAIPYVEADISILNFVEPFDENYASSHNDYSTPALFKPWTNTNLCLLYTVGGSGDNTYTFFANFLNNFTYITSHNYTTEQVTRNFNIVKTELFHNGWDLRNSSPTQPNNDSLLTYQLLADTSQEDVEYSEVIQVPTEAPITDLIDDISNKEPLGEDAAPYKYILPATTLNLQDLQNLAARLKDAERQVVLDLSNCTLANNARRWQSQLWMNCVSLRELIVPKNLLSIESNCFLWCTYLRAVDLSPAKDTFQVLGSSTVNGNNLGSDNISDQWAQYSGTFMSTRVRTLMIPKNVSTFTTYLTYSSNIKNMIMLHTSDQNWPRCSQRTFGGTSGYGDTYTNCLPEGFHLFIEQAFNNKRPANGSYTNGVAWYSNNGWYTTDLINSIVVFNKDWNQSQWRSFNNTYNWGEELINQVRAEFGKTDYLEI